VRAEWVVGWVGDGWVGEGCDGEVEVWRVAGVRVGLVGGVGCVGEWWRFRKTLADKCGKNQLCNLGGVTRATTDAAALTAAAINSTATATATATVTTTTRTVYSCYCSHC
jgi:hypothetical protein